MVWEPALKGLTAVCWAQTIVPGRASAKNTSKALRITNSRPPAFFYFRPAARSLATAAMAVAVGRTAVPRLRNFAIGSDAGLGERAPEETVIGARHGGVGFGPDILALGMKRRTQPRTIGIEPLGFFHHATPPAFRMARFTATRARWIFCLLLPRLLALATAAWAACSAVDSLTV